MQEVGYAGNEEKNKRTAELHTTESAMSKKESEESVRYFILACARVSTPGRKARKIVWCKPANSEAPIVAIASQAWRLSRLNSQMQLYRLAEDLRTGESAGSARVTDEFPKTIQLTRKQTALVKRWLRKKDSSWLLPPPKGRKVETWQR